MFGYNLYVYCGNNPVCRADYNGEWWQLVIFGIAVIISCTLLSSCQKGNSNNGNYYGDAYSYNNLKTGGGNQSPNCYAYALGYSKSMQPGKISGNKLDTTKKYNMSALIDAITKDLEALGRGCRVLKSINDSIAENEYRIAVSYGKRMYRYFPGSDHYEYVQYNGFYDYHFMVQLSDGTWSEKHGTGGSSIQHNYGETPDTLSWDLGNLTGYYNGGIKYLAITR